jgi:outer membrane protein insertion porin family
MSNKNMRLLLVAIGLLSASFHSVASAATFTVGSIEIRGITRTDPGTVLNYLPVQSGDVFDLTDDTGRAIRALYETGLFNDVSLSRRGDVLIVELIERPVISTINIEGNDKIDDEQLQETLRFEGIYRGRVFNRSVLETVQRELRRLYFSTGNYSMEMETTVKTLERNRVEINIDISEGRIANIRHINIVGNEAFGDIELLDLIESGVGSGFFSSADEYSRLKLEGDLETLRSYYFDRGYINFSISSTQVSITPDRKDIYITINLEEGDKYTINKIVLSGEFAVPKTELESLITFDPGDYFSRQKIVRSKDAIANRLGEEAYAFANVNVSTRQDEKNKTIDTIFFIDPGKRVYVNRITFTGHGGTSDYVFRREMRLIEGGRYSPQQLNRSRVRLQRLAFITSVEIDTPRVPGTDDLIDINVQLVEGASGSFTAGLGIGSDNIVISLGLTQNNFLGTGNQFDFSFDTSRSVTQFSIKYGESYHTVDGVSRTVHAYIREKDASQISETVDYIRDARGFGLNFGVPLSEFTKLSTGVNFENTQIFETAGTSDEIKLYLKVNGNDYNIYSLTSSYSYDTRNRTVFAETGFLQRVSGLVAVPSSDLEFYKLGYKMEYYRPVTGPLVFSARNRTDTGSGYGDQRALPFFERYYAGGVRSLRGFRNSTLGPKDSTGDAAGGDFRFLNTLELIFPPPITATEGQTRASFFTDFGNVYRNIESFETSEIRASYGIAFVWITPIGPLTFSFAKAYRTEPEDSLQPFQFTVGSVF